jgi:hypothetical protein
MPCHNPIQGDSTHISQVLIVRNQTTLTLDLFLGHNFNPNLKSHLLHIYICSKDLRQFSDSNYQSDSHLGSLQECLEFTSFTFSQLVGMCLRLRTSCNLFPLWSWAFNLGCSPFPPRSIQLPSSQGHFFVFPKRWSCTHVKVMTLCHISLNSSFFINIYEFICN